MFQKYLFFSHLAFSYYVSNDIMVKILSYNKYDNNQEMLGWGAYLPLPGFDKKGRMVLFCQMGVQLNRFFSNNSFSSFFADDQPSKDQLQPSDVVLPDGHFHSSQGETHLSEPEVDKSCRIKIYNHQVIWTSF